MFQGASKFLPLHDWESLNSLDLSNGGVALYLENFNRLNCTLAVLFSVLNIDSSFTCSKSQMTSLCSRSVRPRTSVGY